MRLSLLLGVFVFVFSISTIVRASTLDMSQGHSSVVLQDVWKQLDAMVSDMRNLAQGQFRIGFGVEVEAAILPKERDIEGLDRSMMVRTSVNYDPALSLGLSANQSFDHGVWLSLGSEWHPDWAAGTSFRMFYRLNHAVGVTPVGVSTTMKLADVQIECAYNKGVALDARDAVHVSVAMPL